MQENIPLKLKVTGFPPIILPFVQEMTRGDYWGNITISGADTGFRKAGGGGGGGGPGNC